jgi:hypothetical protein
MADQQQTQTLSLRISEALRARLEQIRELTSKQKGENVSTSEVAKQLLESAPTDRLEEISLFAKPTETLLEMRRKVEAGQPPSRAEWAVLASFVQQGSEARGDGPLSRDTFIEILKAFQAAYELRTKDASNQENHYYLSNLTTGAGNDDATPDAVRAAVTDELRKCETDGSWPSIFAGRNLYILLDREELTSVEQISQVLKPYWPVLWRVAARGHFMVTHRLLRDESKLRELLFQPAIAPIDEQPQRDENDKFSLSFTSGIQGDLHLLLSFPGVRGPKYPLGPYPRIAEFRAMLAKLNPKEIAESEQPVENWEWKGKYFLAYVSERDEEKEFWFRSYENGITFGLTSDEWARLRNLFYEAWKLPELKRQWHELSQEYGEL